MVDLYGVCVTSLKKFTKYNSLLMLTNEMVLKKAVNFGFLGDIVSLHSEIWLTLSFQKGPFLRLFC